MKRTRFQSTLAAVACLGMVLPPSTFAAQPAAQPTDVALRQGGMLVGQVVDAQGAVQAERPVLVLYGEQEVVRTMTDENGVFAAQGLRGGQYRIITEGGESHNRLWAANTAPPAAGDSVVVVSDPNVIRGQWGYGGGYATGWLDWVRSHPYITAGIVAAAVAIPLALANDDDDGPNS